MNRRRLNRILIAAFAVSVCLALPPAALLCGRERWPVKVATDPHVKFLFRNADISGGRLKRARRTSIADLIDEEYPFGNIRGLPRWSYTNRVAPVETNIWIVEAKLTDFNAQADEDFHLVLEDESGNEMVAEIPGPNCIRSTPQPLRDMIRQARAAFDARYDPPMTPRFDNANVRVRVTGVGMFDKVHGQRGAAQNGIELHPVLKVEFLD